jgi:hypothetical protein
MLGEFTAIQPAGAVTWNWTSRVGATGFEPVAPRL